ncbi:MAG: hypothetical protein JRI68_19310 [Deltaproteobacteria bacterium]|nr:hypothetical protein [Deltaproteobacteria bacterium]
MQTIAEAYVKLVLAMGQHDPDYVDAYYGPAEWRKEAEAAKRSLADIRADAETQIAALGTEAGGDELERLRHQYLRCQLGALVSRVDLLSGKRFTFDEESKALYDAVAPTHTEAELEAIVAEMADLVPGQGPLLDRFEAYREGFVIPPDKLDAVFSAAIDACRERTKEHLELPAEETFEVAYVTGKSWSAYNWYEGGFKSLIQVNTDLPITIDRAIDLACHEGYPGHHVYNVLLEHHLVRQRGWVEFSVYALFSSQSLIAEGTANFGIDVAFPGDERLAFEQDVLFPLAGLDPQAAEGYAKVRKQLDKLSYAGNEAARRYLDGQIDAAAAAAWLSTYAMTPSNRAQQRVRFYDQYRSYVINYNLGQDMVADYIEGLGGTADQPAKRWEEFRKLISSPRLPSGLR